MTCLSLQSVHKHYGAVAALDGVDLTVAAGSRTAIVGPSGSGKTTLLRVIAGFEIADAGQVTLNEQLLGDGSVVVVPPHLRRIGIVSQDGALFPHLTVAENIGFGITHGTPYRAKRIAELLKMVELDHAMLARRPDQLSGGQQQRVALARALAQKPRLMLLDEPFSALDSGLRVSTRKAVAQLLSNAGVTTVLVTHDQAEALSFADQVGVMREGRLQQIGTPRDIYMHPNDPMIAEFLGEAIILDVELSGGFAQSALGRIPVNDRSRRGAAKIMLRPEQLSLTPVSDSVAPRDATSTGQIVDIDFSGALCTFAVRLLNTPLLHRDTRKPGDILSLRSSSFNAPSLGATVKIVITGEAHVFTDMME